MSSLLVFNLDYRLENSQSCWYFRPPLGNCCPSVTSLPSTFSRTSPTPPPLPKVNVQYIQTVCGCGGVGGCWSLTCIVDTGRHPPPLSSVLYGIISKDVHYWPHNYSLEKNQVLRELALIAISLACLVAQWYSYSVFYLSWELSWCRVSFLKGDLQFSKLFKNTTCICVCTLQCTEKRFIPFTPLNFLS